MSPTSAINFIIFLCTNFMHCHGMLMSSSRDGKDTEWIYILLNVWLLTLITLALWRYFRSVPQTGIKPPSSLTANNFRTPVTRFPTRNLGFPRVCPCALCNAHMLTAAGNWAPQYHTQIYCNGSHAQHGTDFQGNKPRVLPRDVPPRDVHPRDFPPRDVHPRDFPPRDFPPRDVPPRDPHPRRRRRYRRRGRQDRRDLSPEMYRRFSPFEDLSSVSFTDANEPAPVPLNSPNLSPGSIAQDEDSASENSFLSSTRSFALQPLELSPLAYNLSQDIDISTTLT